MDSSKYDTLTEYKCDLAHEIGHIETGSFYNFNSPYDLWEKCERKANRRAVEILMPIDEVREALRRGCRMAWALAEWFDVTQDFAQMALDFYAEELKYGHHKQVAGLPPMMRAKDLLPRPEIKKPVPPSFQNDMMTLRRLGIITENWRDDPLLNIPYYD